MNTSNAMKKMSPKKAPGLRQTMSNLHTWTGLLVGWVLYAMFLTGTVSYFRDEISQWMRPELAHQAHLPDAAETAQRLVNTLSVLAPDSAQWSFGLPNARNNVSNAFWRDPHVSGRGGFKTATFDPTTGEQVEGRQTRGGDFFYAFHFQFHYLSPLVGRWIAGFCAMFMLIAIVSGIITHKKIFIDFFTFRWGKGQRSWMDAHNVLSVFGLPFHLMITYSGLVTLMLLYMPWGRDAAFKTPRERQALTVEMSAFIPAGAPSGQRAPLTPIGDLVRQAQTRWGHANISRVTITHPGDASARVAVVRGDFARASISPQYLLFDGVSGKLLQVKDAVGAAAETRGVLYALHLGRFADTVVRWLYFLVSLAGTAMVGSGLVLWTVKRRAKLPDPTRPYFGFWLVERLNIAAIAGLSLAMAGLLWANRLLPLGLDGRAAWEIHGFFMLWAGATVWAMVRPAKRAWIELLSAAAAALALLPILSAMTTDRPLWHSVAQRDWVFIGMELSLLVLAALHATLALRATRRHKTRPASKAVSSRVGALPVIQNT